MKAGVLYENGEIKFEEAEMPRINDDEVLVKVKATGICGSDIPRVLDLKAHYFPIILGHEFSGIVEKIGKNVKNVKVGDRVSGAPLLPCMECKACINGNYSLCRNYKFTGSSVSGSFAEYVKIPSQNAVKFSENVSFEQGAFFEPSTVALHGVKCSDYRGGKKVAVVGGGTIGLFTMQWAKIYGAKSVTVFDISDERLKLAKKLEAEYTVNTAKEKCNEKFDWVYEASGTPEGILSAFELAENKAHICFIGTPTRDINFTKDQFETILRKELTLNGSWMSYSAPFPGEEFELTAHFFATGQLKFEDELIYKKFPMSKISDAFDMFRKGKVGGKIMLFNE